MEFKQFLLNESHAYLGQKIGDVLNAVEDLDENGKSMGMRQVMRNAEGIVNQIRRILHSSWPKTENKTLKKLQKAAVSLARALDPKKKKEEQDDIYSIVASVKNELEKLSGKMGVPVNKEVEQAPEQTPEQAPKQPAPEQPSQEQPV